MFLLQQREFQLDPAILFALVFFFFPLIARLLNWLLRRLGVRTAAPSTKRPTPARRPPSVESELGPVLPWERPPKSSVDAARGAPEPPVLAAGPAPAPVPRSAQVRREPLSGGLPSTVKRRGTKQERESLAETLERAPARDFFPPTGSTLREKPLRSGGGAHKPVGGRPLSLSPTDRQEPALSEQSSPRIPRPATRAEWRRAVIWSEILGPPVALRSGDPNAYTRPFE